MATPGSIKLEYKNTFRLRLIKGGYTVKVDKNSIVMIINYYLLTLTNHIPSCRNGTNLKYIKRYFNKKKS